MAADEERARLAPEATQALVHAAAQPPVPGDDLSPREREVLRLRFLRGYSAAEIGAALGLTAGHVRVLQLRALRWAAAHLDNLNDAPPLAPSYDGIDAAHGELL